VGLSVIGYQDLLINLQLISRKEGKEPFELGLLGKVGWRSSRILPGSEGTDFLLLLKNETNGKRKSRGLG
jgi:hypothetical protein